MFCKILSGAVVGVEAQAVWVEVDIDRGLPAFSMVGSLSGEVRESKERVNVALKNSGYALPASKVTVNLAPAHVHKEGTGYDLPIAVGVLQDMQYFSEEATEKILFIGELGLNGEVKPVNGVLPIVQNAVRTGVRECVVPLENAAEAAVVPEIKVRGATHISQVLAFLQAITQLEREEIIPQTRVDVEQIMQDASYDSGLDFSQVAGQGMAKRAAEIAAAGFHNLLMIGPPGAGKSMIAKRIPGILPPLSLEESLEVTGIHSVAGQLHRGQALVTKRPFQSPHHTISCTALIGGSVRPKPGLISLSHRGVLFLDELPEFGRPVIDSMRQPLEDRKVQIVRVGGNVQYPADTMFVAAMNPCPCGYYPDRNRCTCTLPQIEHYRNKISGPIMDRMDLWVQLSAVKLESLQKNTGASQEESSVEIRKRVMQVRNIQEERFRETPYRFNADIQAADMERFCYLTPKCQSLMAQLFQNLQLGARAYHKILKVARTIADLAGAEQITEEHLLEAAGYRPEDVG